jgi:hypothetical protein
MPGNEAPVQQKSRNFDPASLPHSTYENKVKSLLIAAITILSSWEHKPILLAADRQPASAPDRPSP